MEKEMRDFINFCFEHGGFLRNHKEFGEMANALLTLSINSDLKAKDEEINVISYEVVEKKIKCEFCNHVNLIRFPIVKNDHTFRIE